MTRYEQILKKLTKKSHGMLANSNIPELAKEAAWQGLVQGLSEYNDKPTRKAFEEWWNEELKD